MIYQHTGIYICAARKSNHELIVLDFFATVVIDSEMRVKTGETAELGCYGSIVKSIFPDAVMFRTWHKDGVLIDNKSLDWRNWTTFEASVIDLMYLPNANSKHSGFYQCSLFDLSTGRNWTLNEVRLTVIHDQTTALWFLDKKFRILIRFGALFVAFCVLMNFIFTVLRHIFR